jgi:hypothetical protein
LSLIERLSRILLKGTVILQVTDGSGFKRKLYFSTAFHEVKTTPLHCQVPLTALERDGWLNLAFDLVDLFGACFRGLTYK